MRSYNILCITDSNENLFNFNSSVLKNYVFIKTNLSDNLKALCEKYHAQILIIHESLFNTVRNSINNEEIEQPIIILKQTGEESLYFDRMNHHIAILKSPFSESELKASLDNASLFYQLKNENKTLLSEVKRLENREFSLLKKEVLNNLSHEIRTPLNAIVGFAELLISKNKILQANKNYLSIIEESSNRLINYIENLAEFLRHDKKNDNLSFSYISLYELFQSISTVSQKYALSKNITIQVGTRSKNLQSFKIRTDKNRIVSIFSKLITSAIYHAIEGKIEIELFNDEKDNVYIQYSEDFKRKENRTLLNAMHASKAEKRNSIDKDSIENILIRRSINQLEGSYWFEKDGTKTKIIVKFPSNTYTSNIYIRTYNKCV